jgi:hypothetical protein
MKNIIGVYNPYELIQKAGKNKTNKKKQNIKKQKHKKHNKTRKMK